MTMSSAKVRFLDTVHLERHRDFKVRFNKSRESPPIGIRSRPPEVPTLNRKHCLLARGGFSDRKNHVPSREQFLGLQCLGCYDVADRFCFLRGRSQTEFVPLAESNRCPIGKIKSDLAVS
jgi:hypothetical protein